MMADRPMMLAFAPVRLPAADLPDLPPGWEPIDQQAMRQMVSLPIVRSDGRQALSLAFRLPRQRSAFPKVIAGDADLVLAVGPVCWFVRREIDTTKGRDEDIPLVARLECGDVLIGTRTRRFDGRRILIVHDGTPGTRDGRRRVPMTEVDDVIGYVIGSLHRA